MAKRDVQKRIDVQDSYLSGSVQVFGGSGAATPTGDYLRRDGTTPLEGNLIVLDNILIDGVDLSAFKQNYDTHVNNPNAHHPTAGQGQGITLDGSQIVSVRRATVSGLEFDGGGGASDC